MRVVAGFTFAVLVLVLAAAAPAHTVETCHKINARAVGQITSQTAAGATTVSRIIGGGLLHGTTESELVFTSFDAGAGVATFEGPFILTTRHGVLEMFVVGDFDLVTGEFSSPAVVTGGSGRFEGASGSLFLHGFTNPLDGSFIDDEISGTVCLTLP